MSSRNWIELDWVGLERSGYVELRERGMGGEASI